MMRENQATPDFGFDKNDTAPIRGDRDPWLYMCNLM